jgi:hypothetical protein
MGRNRASTGAGITSPRTSCTEDKSPSTSSKNNPIVQKEIKIRSLLKELQTKVKIFQVKSIEKFSKI